jgi:Tfp pilus assembly protein PilV
MYGIIHHRRGISLLEVLISIGILSIGLVSVLALIPAGRSQTTKASALDRTTMLAMNAAADFINRGFARPAGWTNPNPAAAFVTFDPLGTASFWSSTITGAVITPRTDAATTATGTGGITSAATGMPGFLVRSEDDIRYSTDGRGEDDLPIPQWSISGTLGRHVFDGAYSYLATLSGTSSTWNADEYKTLTVVTFNRRDASAPPVSLSPTTVPNADGSWTVDKTNVPDGTSLKDLVKPGAMVLSQPTGGAPKWHRVLLAADMTDSNTPATWKVGLTCENGDPSTNPTTNRVYVFPGAMGSNQLFIKLEGNSVWNDK